MAGAHPDPILDTFALYLFNALCAGLLLFMLSAGLTLIFSMLGVLNFAHGGFYLLGAYLACGLARWAGFWPALLLAPVLAGLLGAAFERLVLGRVRRHGHRAELLATFGLGSVLLELVTLVWGRGPQTFDMPPWLEGAAFTLLHAPDGALSLVAGAAGPEACLQAVCTPFPATRCLIMAVALLMLLGVGLLLSGTRLGLVIRAALTHPDMVQALGHDLPTVFTGVFGAGCALAALAGVVGGISFVTEPGMAAGVGAIVFVVVVIGGLGSLRGAFGASLLVGALQTLPLVAGGRVAQAAPLLPYLLLVVVLVTRP